MILVPIQFQGDSDLERMYKDGYKMGYYDERRPVHVNDDFEKMAHIQGVTDGRNARIKEGLSYEEC